MFFNTRFKPVLSIINDRRASVATTFAISLVPLFAMTGAAIDYSSTVRVRTLLQETLDAAALAGAGAAGQGKSPGEIRELARNYVAANFGKLQNLNPDVDAHFNSNTGAVRVSASLDVPLKILPVIGVKTLPIGLHSQAAFGTGSAEIALIFDTTYSMVGTKLAAAKQAAKSLVDTLFAAPKADQRVKIGLAPFTQYVNVGLQYRNATWISGAQDYTTSSYECWDTYPNATYTNPVQVTATCSNDGVSYDCSYTRYTENKGTAVRECGTRKQTYTWYGCVGSRNYPLDLRDAVDSANPVPALLNRTCPSQLQRLTNDSAAVKAQIDAMTAMQETYIAPGLLWGWRLLSPDAPFGDGQPYRGAATKVLVLLTDGANTKSPSYPDHTGGDVSGANRLTAETCANIQSTGVTIFAIAFDVADPTIKGILQSCASGPKHYFDAGSISEMEAAFRNIGAQLTAVRLTN